MLGCAALPELPNYGRRPVDESTVSTASTDYAVMDLPQQQRNSGLHAAVDSDNGSDGLDHADIDHQANGSTKRAARSANPPRPTHLAGVPAANAPPPLNTAATTPSTRMSERKRDVIDAGKPFQRVAAAKSRPDADPAPSNGMSELEQMQAMIKKRNNALFDQKQQKGVLDTETETRRAPTPPLPTPPPAAAEVVKSDNAETAIQRNKRVLSMMTGGRL